MTRRTIDIREDIDHGGRLAVEGNLVRNVKVLGLESKNGRRYLFEAIKEAVPAYEGLRINLNHPARPTDPRQFGERFGWLENVRAVDGDGMRADLRFNPKHPEADSFAWWAANKPSMIGLSHNAVGQGHNEGGTFIVDKIVKARSVDVVSDPATTRGLMESVQGKPMKLRAFLESALPKFAAADKPGVKKFIALLCEDYGDGDAMLGGEDGAEEMSPEDHLKAGVKNACLAILDDDSIDPKEKVKKLKAYIMAHAKLADGDGEGEEDDEEEESEGEEEEAEKDEEKKKEGMEHLRDLASKDPAVKQLLESHNALSAADRRNKRKAKGRNLCEQLRLPAKYVTDVFLEQLADAKDDKAMKSLIEDRRSVAGVSRPKSAGPDAGNSRLSLDEFAKQLKR